MVKFIDDVSVRYGQRPSDMMGITDDIVRLDFDCAVAVVATEYEKKETAENETQRITRQFEAIGMGGHG